MNLKETEKAYWAGILDGEGCIRRDQNNGVFIPRITLKMTCQKTLEAFGKAFGTTVRKVNRYKTFRSHWKDQYVSDINGKKARDACKLLLPYLITKKAEAEDLVNYYVKSCICCKKRFEVDFRSKKYCSEACKKKGPVKGHSKKCN